MLLNSMDMQEQTWVPEEEFKLQDNQTQWAMCGNVFAEQRWNTNQQYDFKG